MGYRSWIPYYYFRFLNKFAIKRGGLLRSRREKKKMATNVVRTTPIQRIHTQPPKSIWLTSKSSTYPASTNDNGADIFIDPSRSPSITHSSRVPTKPSSRLPTVYPPPDCSSTATATILLPSQPTTLTSATPSTATLARALDFQDPDSPTTHKRRSRDEVPKEDERQVGILFIPPTPSKAKISTYTRTVNNENNTLTNTFPTPTPTPGQVSDGSVLSGSTNNVASTTTIISASLILKNSSLSSAIRYKGVSRNGTNHEQLLLHSSSNPSSVKRNRPDSTPLSMKDMTPLTKDSVRRVRTALDYNTVMDSSTNDNNIRTHDNTKAPLTPVVIAPSSLSSASFTGSVYNDQITPVLKGRSTNEVTNSRIPNLRIDIPPSITSTNAGLPVASKLEIHTPRISTPSLIDHPELTDQPWAKVHPLVQTPSASITKHDRYAPSSIFQTPTTTIIDRTNYTNVSTLSSLHRKGTPVYSQTKGQIDSHQLLTSMRNSPYGGKSTNPPSSNRTNLLRRPPDIVSFAFVTPSILSRNVSGTNASTSVPSASVAKPAIVASNVVLSHVNNALETQRIIHQSSLDQQHDNLTEQRIRERIQKSVNSIHYNSGTSNDPRTVGESYASSTVGHPDGGTISTTTVQEFFDSLDRLYYDTYNEYDDDYYLSQAKLGLSLLSSRSEIILSLPSLLTKDYFNTNTFPYGIQRTTEGLQLDEKICIPIDQQNNINYKDLLQANMTFLRLPLIRIQHILELCRSVLPNNSVHEEYQRLVGIFRNSRHQLNRMT